MTRNCSLSVADQIARLRRLDHGWLDGEGTAYDDLHLHVAEVALVGIALAAEWTPYVYPSLDGCVRAEFDGGTGEYDLSAVVEIWPGDGRISLSTDDDDWWNVDVEFAAEELRRIGHAN